MTYDKLARYQAEQEAAGRNYTQAELERLTVAQINENWPRVRDSLADPAPADPAPADPKAEEALGYDRLAEAVHRATGADRQMPERDLTLDDLRCMTQEEILNTDWGRVQRAMEDGR